MRRGTYVNFSFERTFDFDAIKRIVTDPHVYGHVSDDTAPKPDDYQPNLDPEKFWHVLCKLDGLTLGLFILLVSDLESWEVHTCLLPASYGKAAAAGRQLLAWIWQNTPCRRVATCVPVYNRLALAMAKASGMTEFRREPKLYLKRGNLEDVIFLEIFRPESGEERLAACPQ